MEDRWKRGEKMERWPASVALALIPACFGGRPEVMAAGSPTPAKSHQPHIALVVVDDLGWHNLHAPPLHVNSEIYSPHLARLAKTGITLSNHYKYCGPSRASLLSGRLPGHGITERMFSPAERLGYNANLTFLPAKLAAIGYRTEAYGKWHCGFAYRKYLPGRRGFHRFTGYLSGAEDHFTQQASDVCNTSRVVGTDLWNDPGGSTGGGSNAFGLNGSYSAEIYTSLAVNAIEEAAARADQPLFLYLSLQNVHGPDQAQERFLRLYNESMYPARRMLNAMISTADESIGNISGALERTGLVNDTIMIVISDNGGPIEEASGSSSSGNNWPLRAGKYSLFEGGIKTVAFVKYPKRLGHCSSKIWDGLIHNVDWYPTLLMLAGADPADDGPGRVKIDGLDMLPALALLAPSPRTELVIGLANGSDGSYRNHSMKLIVGLQKPSAWVGPRYPNQSTPATVWPPPLHCQPACLFNLTADPEERVDLSEQHPKIRYEMHQRFLQLAAEMAADDSAVIPLGPHVTDPAACAAVVANGGWWGPWMD